MGTELNYVPTQTSAFCFFYLNLLFVIKKQHQYLSLHNFNNSLPAKNICQLSDF